MNGGFIMAELSLRHTVGKYYTLFWRSLPRLQRKPRKQEKQDRRVVVHREHDGLPRRELACRAKGFPNAER